MVNTKHGSVPRFVIERHTHTVCVVHTQLEEHADPHQVDGG